MRNSPEVEVALFDLQEDGTLFLKAGGMHLTSKTEDRYLLSVKATDTTATPACHPEWRCDNHSSECGGSA